MPVGPAMEALPNRINSKPMAHFSFLKEERRGIRCDLWDLAQLSLNRRRQSPLFFTIRTSHLNIDEYVTTRIAAELQD